MLHTLRPAQGSTKLRKRVGRGCSAGGGKTAGRGTKGQQSRTGKGRRFGFEGGQTPLLRRQPKLSGFLQPRRKEYEVLDVVLLDERLTAGAYDTVSLRQAGLLRTGKPVKILGKGSLTKKFTFTVDAVSEGAKEAIEKAGGSVSVPEKQPQEAKASADAS